MRLRNRSSASRNCTPMPGTMPCSAASPSVTRCMTRPLVVAEGPPSGSSSWTVITSSTSGGVQVWMNTPAADVLRVLADELARGAEADRELAVEAGELARVPQLAPHASLLHHQRG